jgi:hypothetical protein
MLQPLSALGAAWATTMMIMQFLVPFLERNGTFNFYRGYSIISTEEPSSGAWLRGSAVIVSGNE